LTFGGSREWTAARIDAIRESAWPTVDPAVIADHHEVVRAVSSVDRNVPYRLLGAPSINQQVTDISLRYADVTDELVDPSRSVSNRCATETNFRTRFITIAGVSGPHG